MLENNIPYNTSQEQKQKPDLAGLDKLMLDKIDLTAKKNVVFFRHFKIIKNQYNKNISES